MNPLSRRNEILEMLHSSHEPVSASSLAEKFNVSRQIIVGDVAILRAEGQPVMATPRGYILEADVRGNFGYVGTVAVRHRLNRLQEELYIIVDYGRYRDRCYYRTPDLRRAHRTAQCFVAL